MDISLLSDPAEAAKRLPNGCAVCGGRDFAFYQVLWQALIDEWQLSEAETAYINLQQGLQCTACLANLRSMVLARAVCTEFGHDGTLRDWLTTPGAQQSAVLEINEAGFLTPHLSLLPGHQIARYPEYDIHHLPFEDGSFDVVIHSDTLEHVANPVHALGECRRVLRSRGLLAFTVPVVVGRLTRSREGLPPSLHGNPADPRPDFVVHTEFGADFWTVAIAAGFATATIHTALFPASLALTARK